MSKSKRDIVLSLIVLVTLSGCSGGRLRQMFAPDREFMALSELDQPVDADVTDGPSRGRLSGILASASKEKRDEAKKNEAEDQIVQTGFLRRLLKKQEEEKLPTDPFLDEPESKDGLPVVTAGKSRGVDDNADAPNIVPKKKTADAVAGGGSNDRRTDSSTTAAGSAKGRERDVAAAKRTYGRPPVPGKDDVEVDESLSDLIAEFRNDEELFPPSRKESAASEQIQSIRRDAHQEAEEGFNEFLEYAFKDDSAASAESSGNASQDDFELDIAMLNELTSPDTLKDRDSEYALPAELDNDIDDVLAESLIQKTDNTAVNDPGSDRFADEEAIDVVRQEAPLRSESAAKSGLWESPNDSFNWGSPGVAGDKGVFDDESLWSGFPEVPVSAASTESRSGASPIRTTVLSESDGSRPTVPTTTVPLTTSRAGTAQASFESDPFLADFEEQADSLTGAADLPPAGAVAPGGSLGGIAPRAWLLILAGVVVLYLLIVPERRNPSHPTNR